MDRFSPHVQRGFVWTGPGTCVVMVAGLLLAGMLPPTSPVATAEQIANHYRDHQLGIRLGCVLMMSGFALMGVWGATVAMWTRRTERGFPVASYVQLVFVAASVAQTLLCPVIWAVAAFRPDELGDGVTRMLNDLGWYLILFNAPLFEAWVIAAAVAILRDKSAAPAFPRWTGYLSLSTALLNLPACCMAFFKTGPLAYNGVFAFYIPFGIFFVWVVCLTYAMFKHVSVLERELAGPATSSGPSAQIASDQNFSKVWGAGR